MGHWCCWMCHECCPDLWQDNPSIYQQVWDDCWPKHCFKESVKSEKERKKPEQRNRVTQLSREQTIKTFKATDYRPILISSINSLQSWAQFWLGQYFTEILNKLWKICFFFSQIQKEFLSASPKIEQNLFIYKDKK